MYLVFKYKKVFCAQLWLATSRSNGKSWTEAARPLFPCQTSGLAATKLQRFISGQTARVTWQKRPGRQELKNARLTGPKTRNIILPLYKTLIRPHLEYEVQFWGTTLRKHAEQMERSSAVLQKWGAAATAEPHTPGATASQR